jgi:hypothetical protein
MTKVIKVYKAINALPITGIHPNKNFKVEIIDVDAYNPKDNSPNIIE